MGAATRARRYRRNASKASVKKQAHALGLKFDVLGTDYSWRDLAVMLDHYADTGDVLIEAIPPGLWVEPTGDDDEPLRITDRNVATWFEHTGPHPGRVHFVDVEDLDELSGFHASSLTDPRKRAPLSEHVLVHANLSYGDYAGSGSVGEANVRVVEDMLEEDDELEGHLFTVGGSHGYQAIAIRMNSRHPEVLGLLERLASYPLLDEEAHSELELERAEEAWQNWGRDDFVRRLEAVFNIDIEDDDEQGPQDDLPPITQLFQLAQERSGDYGATEGSGY